MIDIIEKIYSFTVHFACVKLQTIYDLNLMNFRVRFLSRSYQILNMCNDFRREGEFKSPLSHHFATSVKCLLI